MGPENHRARGAPGGERNSGLPGQPLRGSRGGPAPLGEDFLSGPKGLMGKGIALAKFVLSPPAGQGFLDKGRSSTPTAPRPLPSAFPKPPLRVSPCLALKAFPFTSSCCSEVGVSPPLSNF